MAEFSGLTRPSVFRRSTGRHGVQHHMKTTPGFPVMSKPWRRLAPDQFKQMKMELKMMIEQGVIRPSNSLLPSPLHVVPKKDRGLQSVATIERWTPITYPRGIRRRTSKISYSNYMISASSRKSILFACIIRFRWRPRTSKNSDRDAVQFVQYNLNNVRILKCGTNVSKVRGWNHTRFRFRSDEEGRRRRSPNFSSRAAKRSRIARNWQREKLDCIRAK